MANRMWSLTCVAVLTATAWCLLAETASAQFYGGGRGGVGISIGTGGYYGGYGGYGSGYYGNRGYSPYGYGLNNYGYGYGNYGYGNYGYGNRVWGYNPGLYAGNYGGLAYNSNYYGANYRPGYYGGLSYSGPAYTYGNYQPAYYGGMSYSGPAYASYGPSMNYQSSYPPGGGLSTQSENSAGITVVVPANAEIWFDGSKTQQTGPTREFMTPSLTPGKSFTYEVRARWMDGANEVDQTRTVTVTPGKTTTVNFTTPEK
jgi:uncharacterized protein (TIGR03000 family)